MKLFKENMGIVPWEMIELSDNLRIVEKLNLMLKLDPEFTHKIVSARFPVNDKYADSEFVCQESANGFEAGLVGVLNGLIDSNDKYRICSTYDDDGNLICFELLEFRDGKLVPYTNEVK